MVRTHYWEPLEWTRTHILDGNQRYAAKHSPILARWVVHLFEPFRRKSG